MTDTNGEDHLTNLLTDEEEAVGQAIAMMRQQIAGLEARLDTIRTAKTRRTQEIADLVEFRRERPSGGRT